MYLGRERRLKSNKVNCVGREWHNFWYALLWKSFMAEFLVENCGAENVTIFDTNRKRRLRTGLALTEALVKQGWTVFVYSEMNGDAFAPVIDTRNLRRYVPIDYRDVEEIIDNGSRQRTAVVIDGLLNSAGAPMKRLLKQSNIFVLTLSSARSVRGDHRYGRLWTPGMQWRLRYEPKEFTEVEAAEVPAQPQETGWFSWLW